MKIGFYIKWNKHSLESKYNVLGDELFGESLCRALRKLEGVTSAEVFAPNHKPAPGLDVMVYLNDTEPEPRWARKHVLYLQNAYHEEAYSVVKRFHRIGYNGYVFFSSKLLEIHRTLGYQGFFLPFGVELDLFHPRHPDERYAFEVAYVGNDIKGAERSSRYLLPAAGYRFGLYGNWRIARHRLRFWKNWEKQPEYRQVFQRLSLGKIPQEDVPILYSSARINLNCTIQACVDWDVVTMRTLEVLACKGFLISDEVQAARQSIMKGMVFTSGGDDLTGKIDYYLAHDDERREIAEQGYRFVVSHASMDARARELLEYLAGIA